MSREDTESIFISFDTVKNTFKKYRSFFFRISLISALLTSLFLLIRTPTYLAEASFRQSSSHSDDMKSLKGLFATLQLRNEDSDAIPLMLSRRLLFPIISKMGLQAEISPYGWAQRLAHNVRRNLLRECGLVSTAPETFILRNIEFSEEVPASFFLLFKDLLHFELLDASSQVLGTGELGKKCSTTQLTFTLEKIPKTLECEKKYPLKLYPLAETLPQVLRYLHIKPSKLNPRLLTLSFIHPVRETSSAFLNQLMHTYEIHLKEENDQTAAEQLVFLDKRRDLLASELNNCLETYANYLKKNLREHGIMGLGQHLELTALPLETQYVERLSQIALQKQSFQAKGKFMHCASYPSQQIRDFQGVSKDAATGLHAKYNEELEALHLRIQQLTHIIERIDMEDFALTSLSGFLLDPISQNLLRQASDLSMSLHDQENRSEREQERLKETLKGKKRFLQEHVHETLKLEKLSAHVLEQKIASLHGSILHLLQKEEQQLLAQLHLFREQMASFPDKWQMENVLEFKKAMTMRVMDAMSQLSETKTVQNLLFQVESKPLDTAYAPIKPRFPALLLLTIAMFCITLFSLLTFRLLVPRA